MHVVCDRAQTRLPLTPTLSLTLVRALTRMQDPVHGQKVLSGGALLDIMDSQPFQRLRELCQLGTTKCVRMSCEVFSSASGSLPNAPVTCAVWCQEQRRAKLDAQCMQP